MKIAIYPGSFDPITLGHLDILSRAARCFDKVYMCVMVNCEKKQPMFSQEKRLELIPPLHRPYPQCRGGAVLRPAGGLRPPEKRPHHRQGRAEYHGF